MSGIEGTNRPCRTEDLVDRLAHDAGLVGKDEHVKGRAGTKSSAAMWEGRHDGEGLHAVKDGVTGVVREVGPEVLDHALEHALVGAAGATAAGGVIAGAVHGAYHLYSHWAHAHHKGDELRAAQHNDAVNVALAKTLSFDEGFGRREASMRPGVAKGTGMLVATLRGKDAAMIPVLQARADEGFLAQKRAFDATSSIKDGDARSLAMTKWLDANGFADRRRYDVAFGKGSEYFLWCKAQPGGFADAETKKVLGRKPPETAFTCRG